MVYYCWKISDSQIPPVPADPWLLLHKDDVKEYLAISLPSMVLICAEWWAYDILTLIGAMISISALGVMTISANFFSLVF